MNKRQKKKNYKKRYGINPPSKKVLIMHRLINEIISAVYCDEVISDAYIDEELAKLNSLGRMRVISILTQYGKTGFEKAA